MKPRSVKTSEESLQQPPNRRLVSLLSELAPRDGFLPSRLPDVSFMRTTRHIPRTPITYEPGIFIMAQGHKTGYLGDNKFISATAYQTPMVRIDDVTDPHWSPLLVATRRVK